MADALTDANDLARVGGNDAVRAMVDAAQPTATPAARGWPDFEDVVHADGNAPATT